MNFEIFSLSIRLMGAALLTAAGWMAGNCRLRNRRRTVRLLRSLSADLRRMEDEITVLRSPFPVILDKLEGRPFFGEIRRKFGTAPLRELWRETALALEGLPEETKISLASLGEVLGGYDAERQAAELEQMSRYLDRCGEASESELRGKAGAFTGVGAALGAILAALLF